MEKILMQPRSHTASDYLFQALSCSMSKIHEDDMINELQQLKNDEMIEILHLADQHEVLPLLYDIVSDNVLTEPLMRYVDERSRTMVVDNYRLMLLSGYATKVLENEGITSIVLKGASTACFYPVPELRKSTDVDLLITNQNEFKRASNILLSHGFIQDKEQHVNHHKIFRTSEGLVLELHSMLVEPFESQKFNHFLKLLLCKYAKHIQVNTSWGIKFYEPQIAYHAYYLLLHMMQHFLRRGFGLRNLCDWVMVVNHGFTLSEQQQLLSLIRTSGMQDFTSAVTQIGIDHLGIHEGKAKFLLGHRVDKNVIKELLNDIMQGGEFGNSQEERMVMLRGKTIYDYMREFHHQMKLNYTKLSKIVFLWPILWISTGIRFVYNNHYLRKISSVKLIETSRKRSSLFQKLKIRYH